MLRFAITLAALSLTTSAWSDAGQETFANCADGFNSQDCNHINEANGRFSIIEGEQAVQNDRLDELEAAVSDTKSRPRWAMVEVDEFGNLTELADLQVNQMPFNTNGSVGSIFIKVARLDGTKAWTLGAYSSSNGRVTPTWQGLDGASYSVVAFAPGTGCSGEPVALFTRTDPSLSEGPSIHQLFTPVTAAYDSRTGKIYRSGGGNVEEFGLFDVYEYGYDKGWLPNGPFGCTQNVDVGSHRNFVIQEANGRREVLKFPNPTHWGDNPYFDPNYERSIGPIIVD